MDQIHWQAIERNRSVILDNLDVSLIADELYSKSLLTAREHDIVQETVTFH